MSYDAWENSLGEAINQVAVFCRHVLRNSQTFDNDTQPPEAEVEIYLSNNYAKMAGVLARYGISTAQTNELVIRVLQSFQVSCTVVDVERALPNTGMAKTPNNRFMSFLNQCDSFEKYVGAGNLQAMDGIVLLDTGAAAQGPEWTGASLARKAIIYQDTDRVRPDITREMMKNPLATDPELDDE